MPSKTRLIAKDISNSPNANGATARTYVIITAVVIYFTGFMEIDPILGMAFGVVLTYASIGIVRDSLKILSETVPKDVDLDKVKDSLEAIPGVKNVPHIHAWTITPGVNIFSTHIHTDDLSKSDDILQKATSTLKEKFDFYFSTIQVENCAETFDSNRNHDNILFKEEFDNWTNINKT